VGVWIWLNGGGNNQQQQTQASAASENCIRVHHLSPNVIPHYLRNSIGSENFPYYLQIIAQSKCSEDRFLTLRFEGSENVVLQDPPQLRNLTVRKGETVTRTFNPRFDWASVNEPPDSITFHWSVEDEQRTKVAADSIRVEIVPPLTVAWDLQKPMAPKQRTAVEREFLLASLKAWIMKPPQKVVSVARTCRMTLPSKVILEREAAIRACYRHLFTGDRAVSVSESPIEFPAGVRQRIRPHVNLLDDRENKASSLEAAMLFVAVMDADRKEGIEHQLVLIVAPVHGSPARDRKTAFIAWRDAGGPWHAIDLRMANAQTFEENLDSATRTVVALSDSDPEISKSVNGKGVFYSHDGKYAAINFAKVPTEYQIGALP